MKVGKLNVTLNNYQSEFSGYSQDTLDVIRSAILDDIPLGKYIAKYANDPYRLWQIKLAIQEYMDTFWFDLVNSGEELRMLRDARNSSINIDVLQKYYYKGMTSEALRYIIKWCSRGTCLDKYQFNIIPNNLYEVFDYGICKGYPMYLFNNGVSFSRDYIMQCLKIYFNTKSVDMYLSGNWDLENLKLLAVYSKSKYYSELVKYISVDITPTVLEEFYNCAVNGLSLEGIYVSDSEYPYSGVHIRLIREAFLNKLDYKKLENPSLTIQEVISIYSDMEGSRKAKISGTIRKNKIVSK